MIEISNRHYSMILDKLPGVLQMAREQATSLRQSEDIRLLTLMHKQLKKKNNNGKTK